MSNSPSILAALLLAVMLSGCEQARVDAQMEQLCKQDGGMKIYETVILPKEQFTPYGDIKFFQKSNSGGGYQFESKSEQIKVAKPALNFFTWNPANLHKFSYFVIREDDKRVLGSLVMYHRLGGAIVPRLGPDPAKHCPIDIDDKVFLRTVFVQDK